MEKKDDEDLRPEYDLRSLRPRKVGSGRKNFGGKPVVHLEADVAEMFPESESVNQALRFLIRIVSKNDSGIPFRLS